MAENADGNERHLTDRLPWKVLLTPVVLGAVGGLLIAAVHRALTPAGEREATQAFWIAYWSFILVAGAATTVLGVVRLRHPEARVDLPVLRTWAAYLERRRSTRFLRRHGFGADTPRARAVDRAWSIAFGVVGAVGGVVGLAEGASARGAMLFGFVVVLPAILLGLIVTRLANRADAGQ